MKEHGWNLILIKSIVDPEGAVILEKNPEIGGQLDISKYYDVKRGMLVLLLWQLLGFSDFLPVAGKTGAEWDVTKTMDGCSFCSLWWSWNTVAVFIEQAGSGGSTGGPVARAIFEEYFRLNDTINSEKDFLIQP